MPRFALMLALVFGLMLVTPAVANAQDRDCSDFDSQAEAQDFYENAGPGDPHRLDADDDGRACDSNPCPCRGRGGGGDGGEPRKPKRAQTIRSRVIRVSYDRLLAYVRLPSGRQLDRAQIAEGWAKVYVVGRRFRQYGDFKRFARRAKRQSAGAWGLCGGMHVRER